MTLANTSNKLHWQKVWRGRVTEQCLRPRKHSIGYMGDGFYRSKDPTNSIKVLKVHRQNQTHNNQTTKSGNNG